MTHKEPTLTIAFFFGLAWLLFGHGVHAQSRIAGTAANEAGGKIIFTTDAVDFGCPVKGGMKVHSLGKGGEVIDGCWFPSDVPGYIDVWYNNGFMHRMYERNSINWTAK